MGLSGRSGIVISSGFLGELEAETNSMKQILKTFNTTIVNGTDLGGLTPIRSLICLNSKSCSHYCESFSCVPDPRETT